MQAEFTKARLSRKCASIEVLKQTLASDKDAYSLNARQQPRWVRINTLKKSTKAMFGGALRDYTAVSSLSEVLRAAPSAKVFWSDHNIPDLLALPPGANLTKTSAYVNGELILQDKASCLPARLLLTATGSSPSESRTESFSLGDIVDACAAPGNKTTHIAATFSTSTTWWVEAARSKIFACERDPSRSKTLQAMIDKAGATNVVVLAKQDFLALDPSAPKFANVTHLLLDPSCSGSGIVRREDVPLLALPSPAARANAKFQKQVRESGKKRKREPEISPPENNHDPANAEDEEHNHQKPDLARLEKLSNLQSRIVEHAFAFPAATRITYSTCSIHAEENENVVARVLQSQIAVRRGWLLLPRNHQIEGLRKWKYRGHKQPSTAVANAAKTLIDDELDACIRCYPNDDEGTMGFFVCCFVRVDSGLAGVELTEAVNEKTSDRDTANMESGAESNETWSGFED